MNMAEQTKDKGLSNQERQAITPRGVRIPIGKASARQMIYSIKMKKRDSSPTAALSFSVLLS